MRPACLDDPDIRCLWNDQTSDCPCADPDQPDPEPRPTETVPTRGLL
ncbi:hypothetical protein ACFXGT_08210 [Streptomyces sp. NPDC059352]